LTFGSLPNPFKTLSLFNFSAHLAADDIMPVESFFNANLVTSAIWYGDNINSPFNSNSLVVTNNAANMPTKITSADLNGDGSVEDVFSWNFSYK